MSAAFFRHMWARHPNGTHKIPRICPSCVPNAVPPYFTLFCEKHTGEIA